jgi:hypothetical protein
MKVYLIIVLNANALVTIMIFARENLLRKRIFFRKSGSEKCSSLCAKENEGT